MFRSAILLAAAIFAGAHAQAGVLARFITGVGTIDVELYDQDKPVTVENFVAYARSGAWNDTIYHRFVPGFVVQGGSFALPPNPQLFTSVSVGPTAIQTRPAITNEYSVGRPFSNTYGTIAMARVGGQTNSATSSWFFNLENNANLDEVDGGFTVFGRMIRGNAALDYFRPPYPPTLRLVPQSGPNDGIPIFTPDNAATRFWFHVRVEVLTAQITRVPEGNQISWKSVEGLPNVIEYTRVMPPVWQELHRVEGTGATLTHTDPPSADTFRHYRIRVLYPTN